MNQALKNEALAYVKAHLRQPLKELNIGETHVIQLLQFFLRVEDIQQSNRTFSSVHEHLAVKGWFDLLRSSISGDLKVAEVAAPRDDPKAKETLTRAITKTQALYFTSVHTGSPGFKPMYQLTNYAKRNLCPCCRGNLVKGDEKELGNGSWEEFEQRMGLK